LTAANVSGTIVSENRAKMNRLPGKYHQLVRLIDGEGGNAFFEPPGKQILQRCTSAAGAMVGFSCGWSYSLRGGSSSFV
jgi:hypothetical protein